MAKRNMGGRPPTGLLGEVISRDYHRFSLRMPVEAQEWLVAASGVLNRPQWRVLVDALLAYVGEAPPLTAEKVKTIRRVRRAQLANGTVRGK